MAKIKDIADAIAAVLRENDFPEAQWRALPILKREDAASRKTLVLTRNIVYQDGIRSEFDRICDIAVVIQQACTPSDDTLVNKLLGDVEDLVGLWGDNGPLREPLMAGAHYVDGDGPDHPTGLLFEPQILNDEHLFTSYTSVKYGLYC